MNPDLDQIANEPKRGGHRFVQDIRGILIRKRGTTEFRPALDVIAEQRALRAAEAAKG